MKRVLITAVGCPGASNLIIELKKRGYYIYGVDISNNVIGRFLVDDFSVVHSGKSPEFIEDLIKIVNDNNIDVIFPESSFEVMNLSENQDKINAKVMVSDPEPLKIAINKTKIYETLKDYKDIVPKFIRARSLVDYHYGLRQLGYFEGLKVVCRLPTSKGGRGLHILNKNANFNIMDKKVFPEFTWEEIREHLCKLDVFPEFLMTEFLEGEEIDSMAVCYKGETFLITHKTREEERWGTITYGKCVKREELNDKISRILDKIKLSYNVGIQFKGGKLIEINPRTSTYIYDKYLCEAELAIGFALEEYNSDFIRLQKENIPYGKKMIRYMTQKFY